MLRKLDATGLPLLLARVAVGVAFLWMGASKVSDPVAFLKVLREYDMFPPGQPWLMNATAAVLPFAEVLCGALLLLGIAVRGAAALLLALLLVFSVAIFVRASSIADAGSLALCAVSFDCGCGSGVVNACRKLVDNGVLIALCVLALASRSWRWCLRGDLLGPAARAA